MFLVPCSMFFVLQDYVGGGEEYLTFNGTRTNLGNGMEAKVIKSMHLLQPILNKTKSAVVQPILKNTKRTVNMFSKSWTCSASAVAQPILNNFKSALVQPILNNTKSAFVKPFLNKPKSALLQPILNNAKSALVQPFLNNPKSALLQPILNNTKSALLQPIFNNPKVHWFNQTLTNPKVHWIKKSLTISKVHCFNQSLTIPKVQWFKQSLTIPKVQWFNQSLLVQIPKVHFNCIGAFVIAYYECTKISTHCVFLLRQNAQPLEVDTLATFKYFLCLAAWNGKGTPWDATNNGIYEYRLKIYLKYKLLAFRPPWSPTVPVQSIKYIFVKHFFWHIT